MPQFFLNKRLIVVLLTIIIIVGLIGYTFRERLGLTFPERFLKDTTGLFQTIVDKPISTVSGFFDEMSSLRTVYEENEKLKARLEENAKLETDVARLTKEVEKLREQNGMNKDESLSKHESIAATVIGKSPDQYQGTMTINKGSKAGIEPNMAVMTSTGLIGKVKVTTSFTSTIQMLSSSDLKNRVTALIQTDGIYGAIRGYNEQDGYLSLREIPMNKEVKIGSKVITSGMGGVFPAGLVIGTVKEVEIDQQDLTQVAKVKPYADFYDIKNVLVIKRSMTKITNKSEEGDLDL